MTAVVTLAVGSAVARVQLSAFAAEVKISRIYSQFIIVGTGVIGNEETDEDQDDDQVLGCN